MIVSRRRDRLAETGGPHQLARAEGKHSLAWGVRLSRSDEDFHHVRLHRLF
jgi:hypothetical protein